MSVLNQSGEEQVECPLCMEPLEVDDLNFYPCTCGYQICRFCWNRIREGENGLCPACRKAYPENPADFTPLSQEQVAAIKTEKKAREQKRRNKTLESRRALANVRVVQNNLVFVVGLPVRLADPEILKRQEYFGKYGKIHKVVINQSTTYAGSQGPSASAYVTYVSPTDALRAIQGVNNVTLDGRVLKGSLGTTKYCANFMKNQPCPKPDCMYLHELGDPKASFTKEQMHAGLHQVYERKLHNQLLQRDKPDDKQTNSTGNSSNNADKGSSKDGNQSNFIPTTVIASSNINIANSSNKSSKKDSGSSSSGSSSSSSGKEAWPSLGSSPPTDSPTRKQPSPKPHTTVKSQENGTSESSSPTQLQQTNPTTQQQAQTKKDKDQHTDIKSSRSKDSTNGSKKSKNDKSKKSCNNNSSNTNNNEINQIETILEGKQVFNQTEQNTNSNSSVFETTEDNYLTNDIDELESDRHSLLENHDLLDNSDHSLLDDDSTHNLLNDVNNEVMTLQTQREMLASLVDNSHLMPKNHLVNGYGLIDRDMGYLANDRQISQLNQGLIDQKEMLLRERSRSEMMMRQNELLGRRQHTVMVEPKHYMPSSSIGLESASELLGANYHPNPNMLPPFGMRVDNSIATNSLSVTSMSSQMSANPLSGNPLSGNGLSGNSLSGNGLSTSGLNPLSGGLSGNGMSSAMGYMLHNQQLMQQNQQPMQQNGLVNGFDGPQSASGECARYHSENMDKFFTDFHKAQQLRLQMTRCTPPPHHNHVDQMHHKHRMNNVRMDGRAAGGDGDDDLDFDPFKETQKALAEMMETEMMQNNGADRSRLAPPGFAHVANVYNQPPRQQNSHHQSFNSGSAMFSDWTQMDPAIMSTSVNFANKSQPPPLTQHQQELFARFNQLGVQPNGVKPQQWPQQKLWGAPYGIPLPPGFAPSKPPQRAPECVDAN